MLPRLDEHGYAVSYSFFDVAPPGTDHALGGGPSVCSRGRLEATAAVLTGAASVSTTERLLRMWSAPPVAPIHDLLALPSTSGTTRGTILLEFHGAERRLLGWPLSTPCTWLTQNHVSLRVPTTWPRSVPAKVAPRSDDEGRVANW